MTGENLLYLLGSVSLTAGRNIISKKTAVGTNGKSCFFFSQSVLFLSATLLLSIFNLNKFTVAPITVVYGIIYGILLVLSQWMLTLSLKGGDTSVCTVIYSLGFILPTISGALFWNEEFAFTDVIGILIAVFVILLNGGSNRKNLSAPKTYLKFILIAMLSSGGLGIMQKVQQSSQTANQKEIFLIIGFLFAFLVSFSAFLICKSLLADKT